MTRRSRSLEPAAWWAVRRAQSLKPATYRCPLCGYQLHAMSAHVLISPEGDTSRRRHAHAECVAAARLTSYDDWRKLQPRRPGLLARLLRRA
jgi:hypothetical protein